MLALAILCTGAHAFGTDSVSTKDQLLNYMVLVNQEMGLTLTQEEITNLGIGIEVSAARYAEDRELTQEEAYTLLLQEVEKEMPLPAFRSVRSGDDLGHYQLPAAGKGDIDFMDNKLDGYWVPDTAHRPAYYVNEDASYNCAELVWKAFQRAENIDLDSNGGSAVYPNNIRNSSAVYVLKTFG